MSDIGSIKITDAEWRQFQSIPDQGYSHRGWVDYQIARRLTELVEKLPDLAVTEKQHITGYFGNGTATHTVTDQGLHASVWNALKPWREALDNAN